MWRLYTWYVTLAACLIHLSSAFAITENLAMRPKKVPENRREVVGTFLRKLLDMKLQRVFVWRFLFSLIIGSVCSNLIADTTRRTSPQIDAICAGPQGSVAVLAGERYIFVLAEDSRWKFVQMVDGREGAGLCIRKGHQFILTDLFHMLYQSGDNGRTWSAQPVSSSGDEKVETMVRASQRAVDEESTQYFSDGDRIRYTSDGGATWEETSVFSVAPFHDERNVRFAVNRGRIYVRLQDQLRFSADRGATWITIPVRQDADFRLERINSLKLLPDGTLFASVNAPNGRWLVFKSTDGGTVWERALFGLDEGANLLVASWIEGENELYLATVGSRDSTPLGYLSKNGGVARPLDFSPLDVRAFAVQDNVRFRVLSDLQEIRISTDAGMTWKVLDRSGITFQSALDWILRHGSEGK